MALRWILDHPEVSCTIPGGKTPAHVEDNCAASDLPRLDPPTHDAVKSIYDRHIRSHVHDRW